MDNYNWLIIITIFVVLLYSKWIIIILILPFQILYVRGIKRQGIINKIFTYPNILIERLLRGGIMRYSLYWIGFIPIHKIRLWLYRGLGASLDHGVVMHFKTELRAPWNLHIGKRTIIGDNAILDARNNLSIGSNVQLSSNVSIYTMQHNHRDPFFGVKFDRPMQVIVGDRAWIGSNVTVLPGVTIGEGAVCCAGCVVTKDIESYAVVAGIPAKKIGNRTRDLQYEFSGKAYSIY